MSVTSAGVSFTLAFSAAANVVPELSAYATPVAFSTGHADDSTDLGDGALSISQIVHPTHRARVPAQVGASVYQASPGGDYFDRILVHITGSPFGNWPKLPVGNLLSTTLRKYEVWNAFRYTTETLDTITTTGNAGVFLTDNYGTPLQYLPMRARLYDLTVDINGAPTIDDQVSFVFDGLNVRDNAPLGVITGIRLVPFTFRPDWADGLTEGREFFTDIFTSGTQHEQRRALRQYPRRYIELTPKTFTIQESGYLQALLYGWLQHKYGVLAWYDAMVLTAPATAGAFTITVDDTTLRDLVPGQIVLLWTDALTFEARVVSTFDGTTITFIDQLLNNWLPNATMVLPVYIGSLSTSQDTAQYHAAASEARVSFLCDPIVPTT